MPLAPRTARLLRWTLALVVGVPVLASVLITAVYYAMYAHDPGPGSVRGTITVDGVARPYWVHVPASLPAGRAVPLVVSLHPATAWAGMQEFVSGWSRLADSLAFLVAYPEGTGTGPRTWYMLGKEQPATMPDVRYIGLMLDSIAAHHAVDPDRIYVDGMSNGAGMAFTLSCTLAPRIAAVGAVASAPSLPFTWCPDTTPVPLLQVHGLADPVIPFEGASQSFFNPVDFPNVRRWVAQWAGRNRCAAGTTQRTLAAGVTELAYTGCAPGADVVLVTLDSGGHQWPSGGVLPEWFVGRNVRAYDATRALWAFYQAHPRRR